MSIRDEIRELATRRRDAEQRSDYLRHVVREIEEAKIGPGEDARLEPEARRLEHADELRTLVESVTASLEGGDEESILTRLGTVQRALSSLRRIDPDLSRLQELFDTAYYALEELAREAQNYERSIDLDPDRLAEVRQRLDALYRLMKKYGPTLDDVIEIGRRTRRELDLVDSAGFDLRQLESRESAALAALNEHAKALTARRADAATRLARAVDSQLPDLGLADGHFSVVLEKRAEPGPTGAEDVEFRVALNVGHDARPLARVASGGELSRVMLALTTILARVDRVPTLVFDEVDAGIGGRVALQVGKALRRAADFHQVFAISHLPQIAACAHHHIVVSKSARGGVTTADTHVVAGDDRVDEIARMLGGDPEREISRAHARELLAANREA